jgi:hypothetical protein
VKESVGLFLKRLSQLMYVGFVLLFLYVFAQHLSSVGMNPLGISSFFGSDGFVMLIFAGVPTVALQQLSNWMLQKE